MLSLSKKINAFFIPLFLLVVIGCGSDSKNSSSPSEDFLNDHQKLLAHLKKAYDPDTEVALYGRFDADSTKKIIAVKETKPSKTDKWGMKIQLLSVDSLKKKSEVFLPEMSITESMCAVQKLSSYPYDLFYYNSGSFYLGSSGGEVFVYLIDFSKQATYYAHLVIEPEKSVRLFISKNSNEKEVSDFFLNLFKRDYPDLVVSLKDISIE